MYGEVLPGALIELATSVIVGLDRMSPFVGACASPMGELQQMLGAFVPGPCRLDDLAFKRRVGTPRRCWCR